MDARGLRNPSSDLVDHFKLDVDCISAVTQHTTYRSNRSQGLRNVKIVKRWARQEEIGEGTFGSVWREVEQQDGSERAIKAISKRLCTRYNIDYKKELAAMAVLSKYEDIFVEFHGWFESSTDIHVAMEYFQHGDLQKHLDVQLTETHVKIIIAQLLKGLRIMHQSRFTHRDLKPENIFVVRKEPSFWVKIGDFGITKRVWTDETLMSTEVGTRDYLAPEVLGYIEPDIEEYTDAVDMWSLGCVCHRLMTMQMPFAKRTLLGYCTNGSKLPIESMPKDAIEEEGVTFVKQLLAPNPVERLSAQDALQSVWLKDVEALESSLAAATGTHMLAPQAHPNGPVASIDSAQTFRPERNAIDDEFSMPRVPSTAGARIPSIRSTPRRGRSLPNFTVCNSNGDAASVTQAQNGGTMLPAPKLPPYHEVVPKETSPLRPSTTITREFYEAGFDIHSRSLLDSEGRARQAFEWAAEHATPQHINIFLKKDPKIIASALLRWSAKQGFPNVVQLMLENVGIGSASVDDQDSDGRTALYWACVRNYEETARVLLQKGANPTVEDKQGLSPLHRIPLHDIESNAPIVQTLTDYEADFHSHDSQGRTPYEVSQGLHKLRLAGFDPNSDKFLYRQKSREAFDWAAQHGSEELIKLTMDSGAKFDKEDAMRSAAIWGRLKAVEVLLDRNTEINSTGNIPPDTIHASSLHLASRNGHLDIVQLLLDRGAAVNAKSPLKETALHQAVESKVDSEIIAPIVKLLLEKGIDPLAKDSKNRTALKIASQKRDDKLTALLGPHTSKGTSRASRIFKGSIPIAEPVECFIY